MSGSSTDTIRVFIAARPNEAAQAELLRIQRELKKSLARFGLRIKWTDPDTFHITLLFLGDLPAADIHPVFQCLEKTCARTRALRTSLNGAGLFKKSGALWAGIHAGPDLLELQKRLCASLNMEPGRFHAHFTLGRIKKGRPDPEFFQTLEQASIQPAPFDIHALELVKSELFPDGARHIVLRLFSLFPLL